MPKATLTIYELDHDLLPAVCVKCGAPAAIRVTRPIPVPPRKRTGCWFIPLFFVLYLAVPAAIVLIPLLLRRTGVRIPVCEEHWDHWAWRDRVRRRVLWPAAAGGSVVAQVVCLTGLVVPPPLYAHAAVGVLGVGFLIDQLVVGRGEVGVFRNGPGKVRLVRVHPDFVAALTEDRARDRVDNPARRLLRGDMRDDFDDEPEM
ncbi:MAG: hypothetical protein J2P46_10090 [Zavarzinella sp.]|nr:hypothetical protein [Zavarzinella sp.]